MGKSHIMAYLSCSAVIAGSRLVVFDPHGYERKNGLLTKIEPLRPWFLRPPVEFDEPGPVLDEFRWLHAEYHSRRSTKGYRGIWQPVFAVIDEFNELLTMFDKKKEIPEIATIIGNLARGGRKYGIYVIITAHNWNLQNSGGSDVRNNIAGGRIAVGCESGAAATMLNVAQEEIKMYCNPPLKRGDAIIKVPERGLQRVHFPINGPEQSQAVADFMQDLFGLPANGLNQHIGPTKSNLVLLPCKGNNSDAVSPDKHAQEANSEIDIRSLPMHEYTPDSVRETGKQVKRETLDALIYWRMEGMSHRYISKVVKLSGKKYKPVYAPLCRELGLALGADDPMTPQEWEYLKKHHGYSCLACGRREPEIELDPDHVVPRSQGGSDAITNRQPLCRACNASKKDRTVDYRKQGVTQHGKA